MLEHGADRGKTPPPIGRGLARRVAHDFALIFMGRHTAMIDRLEDEIRQYRIEFQRFLNGEAAIPPEEIETKLRRRINQIVGSPRLSSVDRFRLSGLESRFNSLTELFRRRQRAQLGPHPAAAATERVGPTAVDLGPESDSSQVEALYDAIYAERSAEVGLEDFHEYLSRQVTQLRDRTGCDKVRFTVHTKDGKPKLKARGLRTSERGGDPAR